MRDSANSSSTEWETDSDPESEAQSPSGSKPSTPLARVDTLRPLSAALSNSKSQAKNQIQNTECHPQRRPLKPARASRPPSSLSTKSSSPVHPLLGLHPHSATTSTTTTSTSPPINIPSHFLPPLTATLSHQHSHLHEEPQLTPIPIPQSPSLSRPRTTSTLSSPSSSALSSLAHIPTRPPSPYAPYAPYPHIPYHSSYPSYSAYSAPSTPPTTSNFISFFPPSNPFLSLESIHPLLPSPFLGNHLTVLAKRAPVRESLERVRTAKAKADAAAAGR